MEDENEQKKLIEYFPYSPTNDQKLVMQHAECFLEQEFKDEFFDSSDIRLCIRLEDG